MNEWVKFPEKTGKKIPFWPHTSLAIAFWSIHLITPKPPNQDYLVFSALYRSSSSSNQPYSCAQAWLPKNSFKDSESVFPLFRRLSSLHCLLCHQPSLKLGCRLPEKRFGGCSWRHQQFVHLRNCSIQKHISWNMKTREAGPISWGSISEALLSLLEARLEIELTYLGGAECFHGQIWPCP